MAEPPVVRLPALAGRQHESWSALIEIASRLGDHWLLVGGQMVFLHEVERAASETRPTDDVDVVVDLRVQPTGLVHVHGVLTRSGFDQSMPSIDGIAHRYHRGGATFDVLAPDNLGKRGSPDARKRAHDRGSWSEQGVGSEQLHPRRTR